jgi:hypothetical protein
MCKISAADMTGLFDLLAGTPDVPATEDAPLEPARPLPTLCEAVQDWHARHRRAPRFLWVGTR